jgi:hypothetical protein
VSSPEHLVAPKTSLDSHTSLEPLSWEQYYLPVTISTAV